MQETKDGKTKMLLNSPMEGTVALSMKVAERHSFCLSWKLCTEKMYNVHIVMSYVILLYLIHNTRKDI